MLWFLVLLGAIQLLASTTVALEEADSVFELYSNFNIAHLIHEDMGWFDILRVRQHLQRPTLSFYIDKFQYKTQMLQRDIPIPNVYYMTNADASDEVYHDLLRTIQGKAQYVAKPTHMSMSRGVFVVREGYNLYQYNGNQPQPVKPEQVAGKLTAFLERQSVIDDESWALTQVPSGVIVEERLTVPKALNLGDDAIAAVEFKCFVIWGTLWRCKFRRGPNVFAQVARDGLNIPNDPVEDAPAGIEWSRVVELAERLAAHKDMLRVDIFVGVGADATPEQQTSLRYLVNELEIFPTTENMPFEDAAALWKAGYAKGNYKLIPNLELGGAYANMQDPSADDELKMFTVKAVQALGDNQNLKKENLRLKKEAEGHKLTLATLSTDKNQRSRENLPHDMSPSSSNGAFKRYRGQYHSEL